MHSTCQRSIPSVRILKCVAVVLLYALGHLWERLGLWSLLLSQSIGGLGPLDLIGFGTGRETEIPSHICRVLSSLHALLSPFSDVILMIAL